MKITDVFTSSASNEWFTPADLVEAARRVLRKIDLDPASCSQANQVVHAERYYSPEHGEDGLALPWSGRLFVNPPYGRNKDRKNNSNQELWSRRLIDAYRSQEVEEAILIVNSVPEARWFRALRDFPMMITSSPVWFTPGAGQPAGAAKKATAIVYFGPHLRRFREQFEKLGHYYWPPLTALQLRRGAGRRSGKADGGMHAATGPLNPRLSVHVESDLPKVTHGLAWA